MSEQNITATQMIWKPPFLELTPVGHPEVEDQTQSCYIDPTTIVTIRWVMIKQQSVKNQEEKVWLRDVECTEIHYCHGVMHVKESTAVVARLRDKSLGYKAEFKSV